MKGRSWLKLLMTGAVLFSVAGMGMLYGGCKHEETAKYTVTYESGADDATGEAPATLSYAEGETFTLAAADVFSREGYTFSKWLCSYDSAEYSASAQYTMPAGDVTFRAIWQEEDGQSQGGGSSQATEYSDLPAAFYDASNWEYMTNNGGSEQDAGDVTYSLADGSVKFHRANRAIEIGDYTNSDIQFMLKATNDWSIWFNSSSKDNQDNYSYRLSCADGVLALYVSASPDVAAAYISSQYASGEWNKFQISFSDDNGVSGIKLRLNDAEATLTAGGAVANVQVSDNTLRHTRPAMFTTGDYMVVKVWDADNYVQLKPVAKADEKDVPIVAAIGASITEGAGATDFYTESYPAQLQNLLGEDYNVINFGNSGKTVTMTPEDGEPWLEQDQWQGVQKIVPDIAILNIGTNDSKPANFTDRATFKQEYEYLIDQLLSVNPDMRIIICTVPYAYTDIWGINNANIAQYIAPVQREVAQERGYELVDLYEYSQNKSMLFSDGVHPTTEGYSMVVKILEKVIIGGQQALTQEFIEQIDNDYNDVVYGITAGIYEDEGKLMLSVSGSTSLGQVSVTIERASGKVGEYAAAVSQGSFSVQTDISNFDDDEWYDIVIYVGQTRKHIVLLSETELEDGQIIQAGEVRAVVHSWQAWGNSGSFSFTVEPTTSAITSLDASYIEVSDGKTWLVISGVGASEEELVLSINDDNGKGKEQTIIYGVGTQFEVRFDLSQLEISDNWYNIRLVSPGYLDYILPLSGVTNGADGVQLEDGNVFEAGENSVVVKTWEGHFSLQVVAAPEVGDTPVLGELADKFYQPANWEYMTNAGGESVDGGDIVYALADGSVKFHRVNQAIDMGVSADNANLSFMLKGTNDWNIWLGSSSKDNAVNCSYRLSYAYGGLRLEVAEQSSVAVVTAPGTTYAKGEWNRFDLSFATEGGVTQIKLYVNGERAALALENNASLGVEVQDNVLVHTRSASFVSGNYIAVKVWNADDYLQLKPVANADVADVPIIAAVGASITAGANAENFYTESYPAQLQNLFGGQYNVINLGNSGKTVTMTPGDGEPWLEQDQWAAFQALCPAYAVVNIGTNDSKPANFTDKATFKQAYEYLIDQLLSVNPDMHIYVCTVPYAYSNSYGITNANIRDYIAPAQREVAESYENCTLIDLYEYSQNKSLLFDDGIHPHSRGYRMFAEIVKAAFEDNLDQSFVQSINEKYNDKIGDYKVALATEGESLKLTVSGTTTLDENAYISVQLRIDDDNVHDYQATIADGKFSADIDLATLPDGYYNIRVYVYDDEYYPVDKLYYHLVLAEDSDIAIGTSFHTSSREVTAKSWDSGWGSTFSLSVKAYYSVNLTQSEIYKDEVTGSWMLKLSGTSSDDGISLFIGQGTSDSAFHNYSVNIDVAKDGQFTVTYDLGALEAGTTNYYNVRIYFSDGTYFVVPLSQTTYNGGSVSVGDVFECENTEVTVKSWTDGGVGTLSLVVTERENYTLEFTGVSMADGKLIVQGNAQNVDKLVLALHNDKDLSSDIRKTAQVGQDGSFTVEFDLSSLTLANGSWYYLWSSVNDGADVKVPFKGYSSEKYVYGDREYRFEYWEGVAVAYGNAPQPATAEVAVTSVAFEDGYFAVSGTAENVTDLDIYLINTNVEGSKTNFVAAEIVDGQFTVRLSLDTLLGYNQKNIPFNLRYTIDGGSTVNVAQGDLDMSLRCVYNGYTFTLGINNSCVAVYYKEQAPEVAVSSIGFEDGYFTVSGNAYDFDGKTLKIYLINTNVEGSKTNCVTADIVNGQFTVRLSLDTLLGYSQNNIPFNLRYTVDDGSTVNIAQGSLVISQEYYYNGHKFIMTTNGGCVAVKYSDDGCSYNIDVIQIVEEDGKAMLVVQGTIEGDIAAENLSLLLDETKSGKNQIKAENLSSEAGKFSFKADITDIEVSASANTSSEQQYYIRLYNGESKAADINSRWVSDKLFEGVAAGDSEYCFARNSESAYYTLSILRVQKGA